MELAHREIDALMEKWTRLFPHLMSELPATGLNTGEVIPCVHSSIVCRLYMCLTHWGCKHSLVFV